MKRIPLIPLTIALLVSFISMSCGQAPYSTAWSQTFGGSDLDAGWPVQQTSDGGYIIAGLTASYGAGNRDIWLIKTYSSVDTTWNKTFGGSDNDYGRSVQQTWDG